jgi:hypothetical protein
MTKILFGILLGLASVFVYQFHPDILQPILSKTRQIAGELNTNTGVARPLDDGAATQNVSIEASPPFSRPVEGETDLAKPSSGIPAPLVEKKEISYPLWRFDTKGAAERFAESIKKRSRIALKIGSESNGYVTYIRAKDEQEVTAKLERIKDTSGIILGRGEKNEENQKPH